MEIKKSGGIGIKKGIGISKSGGIGLNKGPKAPTADEVNQGFAQVPKVIDEATRKVAVVASKHAVQENFAFWVGVYFISEEQKDAFLAEMKWDVYNGQWVNGVVECKKKGLPLPEAPSLEDSPPSQKWAALVRKP